jgi:hypothetical protein
MTDEASLEELGERLGRLDAPIRIWREQRDRAFDAAFGPKKGQLSNLMARLPQAANAASALGLGPRDEVFAIRGIVHEREAHRLIEEYLGYASRILKQGGRPEWLERGIAAASIDDQGRDYRDWLMSVGDLYLSARAARLDPSPVLKRIAALSNPERNPAAPTPTRDALATFEDSAYFMTSILPQLH